MNVGIGTEAALFPEKEYIMEISFAVQGLHAGSQQQQERQQQQRCRQQHSVPETEWTPAKTGTSCREQTALRTSATAGMPAATWCARNSMGTSQNKDFMKGANSIKNVANSRDASSNMVRQKQLGHKQKQGLHARSQQQQERQQ
jgi:hypothetical protein